MIEAANESKRYQTRFSDGIHQGYADTTQDKGGSNAGFRPHDLLEAAVATCINMTVRVFAETHGYPLTNVSTRVVLDRNATEESVFRYEVELEGDLSDAQRESILRSAQICPVRRTLSKPIRFESVAPNSI